jgi:cell division septum initiation protein DivIVA
VLTPEQRAEMRDTIRRWWEANPGVHTGFFARPGEFSSLIRHSGEKDGGKGNKPGSVFSLVGLDPTAGLDPAVAEVTRTRLFAERAMFMAQRMPYLVRWQAELLADQFLRQERVASVVQSADRFSQAAESASATAAQLPDRITAERKAILEALETQEGRLRELSAEVSRTLAAGEKMSTSLNTTVTTFDVLMKRFGVGEPSTKAAPDTNSPPFNVLDYAQTADRLSVMAKELDTLIKDASGSVDSPAITRRMQDLLSVTERASAEAKSVLNHAFLLAAGLVLLTFVCALVWRRLVSRNSARNPV